MCRRGLLVAMIAVGCGGSPAEQVVAPPTIEPPLPREPAPPPRGLFDCGRDRSLAFRCGRPHTAGAVCDPTGDTTDWALYVWPLVDAAPFDRLMTARLRAHEPEWADACCYSQCVDVASHPTAVDPAQERHARCIAGMPGGAIHAVRDRRDCPAAVDFGMGPQLDQGPSPFDVEASTRLRMPPFDELQLCCYQVNGPLTLPEVP